MVREVQITRGKVVLIDDEDYEAVAARSWSAIPQRYTHYAATNIKVDEQKKTVLLHRFLMKPPPSLHVDHINHDGLDCRRENMRLATPSQNRMNTPCDVRQKGFRGVTEYWPGRFLAVVYVDGAAHRKWGFHTAQAAALARDKLALEFHGDFAVLNFPEAAAA